ncbi:MAG: xylulokinase [Bryobacteraceae bacterium]|nr:xylulokinase [Bryobacteraceae bacterium]
MRCAWLGLDTGTGGTRALLVDEGGGVIAANTAEHPPVSMPRPTWAEQDPGDWWSAACAAIRQVLRAAPDIEVRGIGLTGQMHGLTLLDAAGEVIRPAILWCDQRTQPQVDALNREIGGDAIVAAIANPMLTGFTLPKLLWVRDHEPENFARIRRVLLPKDYVRFRLTGEFASDVTDASGTGLFDVRERRWASDLARRAGVSLEWLPRVFESPDTTGVITSSASSATGLRAGIPVVAGAGDQAASAIGNGIVEPGLVSCTIGTSGVVFAQIDDAAYDPLGRVHTFCHAVPGKWHAMGVTQAAGLSLEWVRRHVLQGASHEETDELAAQSPPGANGLFWLPYLMGERTPHLDAAARGGWLGLTASHTRADLIRAVLEGVAFSQADSLEVLRRLGVHPHSIRLSGGGARSGVWRRIFAGVFGAPVTILETQEGSAYGAALLASGFRGVREVETVHPRDTGVYAAAYARYRELYPALRDWFG